MSYTFTSGEYRVKVLSALDKMGSQDPILCSSEYVPFTCNVEPPPVELYVFRMNPNIKIDPVTLEVPDATLDYSSGDCFFYSNGLEVITGDSIPYDVDRTKYKYLYISFDNSSGTRKAYDVAYLKEVAYFGIPYISENYYYNDGYGCDIFDGNSHPPTDGNNCYINIGSYVRHANNKSNIALSLFHNIPRLTVEGLDNLIQSNVVVTAAMFWMCGGFNQAMFETIRDTWDMSNVVSADFMFGQNPTWYELDRITDWQLRIIQNMSLPNLIRAQFTLYGTHISSGDYDIFSRGSNMSSLASHFSASDISSIEFDPTKISFNAHCRNSAYWDTDEDGYAYMCSECSSLTTATTSSSVLSGSTISSTYPLTIKGMFSGCTSLLSIVLPEMISTSTDTYGAAINFKEFASGCTSLRKLQIGYSTNINDWPIKLSARRINFQGAFNGCQRLQKLNFIIATPNTICDFNENTFTGCSSLTELNLNNMQIRGYVFLDDCISLETLKCPQSGTAATRLPYTMYDSNGTAYTDIPSGNITIYKTNPVA